MEYCSKVGKELMTYADAGVERNNRYVGYDKQCSLV